MSANDRCRRRGSVPFVVVVAAACGGVVAGCGYRPHERAITAADVSEPQRTRLTGYLSAPYRKGQPQENTWGKIPREAVLDEAMVVTLEDAKVCVRLVERTHVGLDRPLNEWVVRLNGELATVDDERVAATDWAFGGQREALVADAVPKSTFASLVFKKPDEQAFRVYERIATVCGPGPKNGGIKLQLELPTDDGHGSWGQVFEWKVK